MNQGFHDPGSADHRDARNLNPDAPPLDHLPAELLAAHVDNVENLEADLLAPHPGDEARFNPADALDDGDDWDH
jgi:hypothetical protein